MDHIAKHSREVARILWQLATEGSVPCLTAYARARGQSRFRERARAIVEAHLRIVGQPGEAFCSADACRRDLEIYVGELLRPEPGPVSARPPRYLAMEVPS